MARSTLALAVLLMAMVLSSAFAQDVQPSKELVPDTFATRVARRPAPDLAMLAARSSPESPSDVAMEAFQDILRLRERPVPEAVPVLIEILEAHRNSTRIHGFAAAQALFVTRSEEARRALEAQLLNADYPVDSAMGYASHWDMSEPQRSQFIETYLLRNRSEDLAVSVEAEWIEAPPAQFQGNQAASGLKFKISLTNRAAGPRAYTERQLYPARELYFRGPSGRFSRMVEIVRYDQLMPKWFVLGPGESHSFEAVLALQREPQDIVLRHFREDGKNVVAVLESDLGHGLYEFGEYEVRAMIAVSPVGEEWIQQFIKQNHLGNAVIWSGRAVSQPIKIQIPKPNGGTTDPLINSGTETMPRKP